MKTKSAKNLLIALDDYPPFLVYWLARRGRRKWAGPHHIARQSGIPGRTVTRLGAMVSWRGVKIGVASAFMEACGVNPMDCVSLWRLKNYMRETLTQRRPYAHLTDWNLQKFVRRFRKWEQQRARAKA